MNTNKNDLIIEETALNFYQEYQKEEDLLAFLKAKLPAQYGIAAGFLLNNQQQLTGENTILFDRLNCPIMPMEANGNKYLIPTDYAYGTIDYILEINQESLAATLEENRAFMQVFHHQVRDSELDITPLSIWLAEDLASFISLNDLEDRLMAEENPPDLVAILNRGLLIRLNSHTIQTIISLSQNPNAQSFERNLATDFAIITEKTTTQNYFKMMASAPYRNCFTYYIFLLEFLKNQQLPKGAFSAELGMIW